jgi:hypothetical protein
VKTSSYQSVLLDSMCMIVFEYMGTMDEQCMAANNQQSVAKYKLTTIFSILSGF